MNDATVRESSPLLSSTLWFLAGGLAGAGIGLLLAPHSGKATRQMMARRASEGADSARRLRDRVVSRGEELWDEATQGVGEAASAFAGAVERKTAVSTQAPPA
jgi:gas vesicle protein